MLRVLEVRAEKKKGGKRDAFFSSSCGRLVGLLYGSSPSGAVSLTGYSYVGTS